MKSVQTQEQIHKLRAEKSPFTEDKEVEVSEDTMSKHHYCAGVFGRQEFKKFIRESKSLLSFHSYNFGFGLTLNTIFSSKEYTLHLK